MILLPCPVRPDLDCLAGAIGYAEYLRNVKNTPAKAWLCGTPDGEAQFYIDLFKDLVFANEDDVKNATGYVLVDFSTIAFCPDLLPADKVIEVIDHRFFTTPKKEFPNARVQLDEVGAAATQIAEYFIKDKVIPSRETACLLYSAIHTHTLCRIGTSFTERDAAALSWLETLELDAGEFVPQQLEARKNEIISQFPDILTAEMKFEKNASGQYGISQLEMIEGESFWNQNKAGIHEYFLRQYDHPVFLNIIDLSTNTSIFYCTEEKISALLQNHVTICQQGDHAVHFKPALMRKHIIPILRKL